MKTIKRKVSLSAIILVLCCLILGVSASGYYNDDEYMSVQSSDVAPQELFDYYEDYVSDNNGIVISGINYGYEIEGELIIPSEIAGNPINAITYDAFEDCKKITSLVVSEGVRRIEDGAFSGCGALASITLPESIEYISASAFNDTEWYLNQPDGVLYCSGCAFGYKGTMNYGEEIIIKEGTKKITEGAFKYSDEISFVTVSEGVSHIGQEAFYCCEYLEEIVLPESLQCVEYGAFDSCYNIKKINYKGTPVQWNKIYYGNGVEYDDVFEDAPVYYHYGTPHTTVTTTKKSTLKANGQIITKCTVCGVTTKTVTIRKPKTIKLDAKKYVCTGKPLKPNVTVKDSNGSLLNENTDYIVTYPEGTEMSGEYKVNIVFTGNYTGTKTLSFTVLPGKPEKLKAKPSSEYVKLSWSKVPGATGYTVYMYVSDEYGSGFLEIDNVKSNTCKITFVEENTKYKFKVQAFAEKKNKMYWSESASTVSTRTLKKKYIDICDEKINVCVGGDYNPIVKKYPKTAKVKWKSNKKSVAKVSSKGKITGVKTGKATITAYFKNNGKTYKDSCIVYVSKPSIMLAQDVAAVPLYSGIYLECDINPGNVLPGWSSSDTSVATVDDFGFVTPKKIGTTVITAYFTFDGKTYKDQCTVKVIKQDPITVTSVYRSIDSAGGVRPNITIKNNTNKDIKYIDFSVEFRNKFGDPAYCEISGVYKKTMSIASGLYAKEVKTFLWQPVIYNNHVHRIDIKSAKITYVDNKTETIKMNTSWRSAEYYY